MRWWHACLLSCAAPISMQWSVPCYTMALCFERVSLSLLVSVNRRSTLAAGGPTKQMDDPRNVRDKGFIRQSLHRLIEFLVENNYDRQISPKQLEAPTTKDFLHILTFLYNKIDPKFVLGPNVAEEVPAIFKRLRCALIFIAPLNIAASMIICAKTQGCKN